MTKAKAKFNELNEQYQQRCVYTPLSSSRFPHESTPPDKVSRQVHRPPKVNMAPSQTSTDTPRLKP